MLANKKLLRKLLIIAIGIIILAAVPYLWIFHNGLSDKPDEWIAFSQYATAIFTLLAFVCAFVALYQTIIHSQDTTQLSQETQNLAQETNALARQSNEKYIESEERSIFFKQLELFRTTTYNIQIDDNHKGLDAMAVFAHELKCHIISYYLYPKVIESDGWNIIESINEKLDIKDAADEKFKQLASGHSLGELIDMRIIAINNGGDDQGIPYYLNYLRTDTHQRLNEIAEIVKDDFDLYWNAVVAMISKDFSDDKFNEIYRAYNYAGYALFSDHESELGNYFRSVYYCLKMIESFDSTLPRATENRETYIRILRSQLSRFELAVLFYNYIGPKSHLETMRVYDDAQIFNNINLNDLILQMGPYDREDSKKEVLISSISLIHRERLHVKVQNDKEATPTLPLFGPLYENRIPHQWINID